MAINEENELEALAEKVLDLLEGKPRIVTVSTLLLTLGALCAEAPAEVRADLAGHVQALAKFLEDPKLPTRGDA